MPFPLRSVGGQRACRPLSCLRQVANAGLSDGWKLILDRTRRVLAGAWAVAPLASEWIHQAALAIRAQVSIEVLLDQVAQFPTYSEAYLAALEQLAF